MHLIRVRRKLIIGIIPILIIIASLFFYFFIKPIPATESSWQIITGKDRISNPEFLSWFDQEARLYPLTTTNNEIVFAPSSAFYVFPWVPPGKKEGRYVWTLNLKNLSLKPILYETFMSLKPQLPGELPKRPETFLQQQADYQTAKNAPLPEMVMEVIRFNSKDTEYEAKLSVSDFNTLKRRRLGTEFAKSEPRGWHTGTYYSGIMQFEVVDLSEPKQPIVVLKKQFKDWDYPLRRESKKISQPSFIGTFAKLYPLPDSKPSFMILSKVYRGLYQNRKGIDDEAFSILAP